MRFTVVPRLALGFLAVAIICGVIGYVGLSSSKSLVHELHAIADDTAPELVHLARAGFLSERFRHLAAQSTLVPRIASSSIDHPSADRVGSVGSAGINAVKMELDLAIAGLDLLVESEDTASLDERAEGESLEKIKAQRQLLYQAADELIHARKIGQPEPTIVSLAAQLDAAEQIFVSLIEAALSVEIEELSERLESADAVSVRATTIIVVVSVLGVLAIILLGYSSTRYIDGLLAERRRAEQELKQAHEVAIEASRAKSRFLSSMSHEIRTPMNTIIGLTESLQRTQLADKQRQNLRIIQRAGDALLSIIDDILDISKVEAGLIELETLDIELAKLVEETTEFFAIQARNKGLELNCLVDPDLPSHIVGDPTRLRQIIVNLLSNSLKFTKEGRIDVVVERDITSFDQTHIVFRVSDTGIGIPETKLESIFDSFTQADSTTTREYGGTGLGLSISKLLVELMGGRISVESKVGQGSSFSFSLPLEAIQITEADTQPQILDEKTLIVDDNSGLQIYMKHLLAEWGIQAETVANGTQALIELERCADQNDSYKLLLLDRWLPDIDGLDLAAQIRSNEKFRDMEIILVTAAPDVKLSETNLERLGIRYCIPKPFKRLDLFQAIANTVGFECTEPKTTEPEPTDFIDADRELEDDRDLRILLVDDFEDNWLVVQSHLEDTNFHIDSAESGEIAVEKFLTNKYDLVLMDIQMPGMDGYAATKIIREWEIKQGAAQTPIIALTANALKQDEQDSIDAGCTAHISKPIKRATLMRAISLCIK